MSVKVNRESCVTCGYCVTNCPVRAIVIKDKKAFIISEKCNDCYYCIGKCLMQAIEPERTEGTDLVEK